MPLIENHRVTETREALAHNRRKLASYRAGGHVPGGEGIGVITARQAWENNMRALESNVDRLEKELVQALLASGVWSAHEVLAKMEEPK